MRRQCDTLTGDLFIEVPSAAPEIPGTWDYRTEVAELISRIIADSGMSRYQIAARMSELADVETSKAVLDSYTSPVRDACNMPLWKAPLIECVASARALAEWHAAKLGGRVIWGAEILDADIGKTQAELDRLSAQLKVQRDIRRRVK